MHADQPPSYDAATTAGGPSPRFADAALPVAGPSTALGAGDKKAPLLGANDKKAPASPPRSPLPLAAPSFPMPMPAPLMSPGGTRVYRYQHPVTGDVITSLLPPDHPQMVCLQEGRHMGSTSFGLIGVLAAVFWFPLGLLCLAVDKRVKCRRCGAVVESGICG